MSACRESKPMERILDRMISEMRRLDKILWSYSGSNIETDEYPLSKFMGVKEAVEDFDVWYKEFKKEYNIELEKVMKLNEEKHPTKKGGGTYSIYR